VASITDGESAIGVLGQTTFTAFAAANTQAGMNGPWGLAYDATGNRLFVSDSTINRVTTYDVAVITNGENAVNVLGQTNFTNIAAANTQAGMNNPRDLVYDAVNNMLYTVNSSAARVTVYDVASITDGESAVDVLGQTDGVLPSPGPSYTKGSANNVPNSLGYSAPYGVAIDATNHRLFVSDQNNNRVLEYDLNSNHTFVDRIPDHVLGQSTFVGNTSATTQVGLSSPGGVAFDATNDRLFIAERTNHRLTVYDTAAITDGESAVNVLGQTTFTVGGTGQNTQAGLFIPESAMYDATNNYLYVPQSGNHRVSVFDVSTASAGTTRRKHWFYFFGF
jgi:DNA-binding beta-propeller fold protein YncE